VGKCPPATNRLIKRKSQKLTRSLKEAKKRKRAPNQLLGLGAVYQSKTIEKKKKQETGRLNTIWPQANLKCTDAESF
jgi:hypothetical protein